MVFFPILVGIIFTAQICPDFDPQRVYSTLKNLSIICRWVRISQLNLPKLGSYTFKYILERESGKHI